MFCIRQPVTSTHRKLQLWQGSSLHPTEQRARVKTLRSPLQLALGMLGSQALRILLSCSFTNKRADSVLQAIQDTFVTTRDETSTHTGTENQME